MRLHRLLSQARQEAGVTLLEVTIALALLSLATTGAFVSLTTFQRSSLGSDIRLENLTEASMIMTTATRDVRTATRPTASEAPFVIADANEMKFYANLETVTGPKLVHLTVSGDGILRETVVTPTSPIPYTYTNPPTVRMVGSYVVNAASLPLFTYLDAAGDVLPTPVIGVDRLRIAAVQIEVVVRKSTNLSVAPTTLRSTVRLPNVEYNPVAS